jgi:hypothetical protein
MDRPRDYVVVSLSRKHRVYSMYLRRALLVEDVIRIKGTEVCWNLFETLLVCTSHSFAGIKPDTIRIDHAKHMNIMMEKLGKPL